MPITSNRYYNDPALGAAFTSLAQAFAPPSGPDAAGYAEAGARKAQASRLAALFDYTKDPNFNQTTFDRMGEASGAWNPSQGYYAVDTSATTARRGQDVEAETSRANNAATNATTLQTNTADNARAVQTSAMENGRQFAQTRYGPIAKDAVLPELPQSVASLYGVPASGPVQGNISLQPDETVVTADGRTLNGQPKQLTEEQWKGQQDERLRQSGAIGDTDIVNMLLGDKTPVQTIGADSKPQFMSPGEAIRTHAQPYDPSADRSLVEGTALIGGKSVQVFRKPNDSAYTTADGQPVPADIQVFEKAKPTGTNEQLGMKPSEFTQKNAMFYNRAASAASNLADLQKGGYVPTAQDFELTLGKAGDILPLSVSNSLVSDKGQQFYNNAMNFMLSVLRPDTGAAFGREEFQNYARVFIPLPGDSPETIAQKSVARRPALAALQGSSAGAADQITRIMQANGVPVPDEMLQHMQAAQQNAGRAAQSPQAAASSGAQQTTPADKYPEGTIIHNPTTGAQMIRQAGKWVSYGK